MRNILDIVRPIDAPYLVPDSVFADKVVESPALPDSPENLPELCVRTEGEEDRPGLCTARIHMADTVEFLLFQCVFVF